MAVIGACQCYVTDSGPCACAQLAAQMMQDIARLNDKVLMFIMLCFMHFVTVHQDNLGKLAPEGLNQCAF